jgi:hypothetical protein
MGFPLKHFQPNMEVTEERKNCINLCHRSSNKRERERVIKHLCFIAGPGGGENESRETFVGFQLGLNLTHTKGGGGGGLGPILLFRSLFHFLVFRRFHILF